MEIIELNYKNEIYSILVYQNYDVGWRFIDYPRYKQIQDFCNKEKLEITILNFAYNNDPFKFDKSIFNELIFDKIVFFHENIGYIENKYLKKVKELEKLSNKTYPALKYLNIGCVEYFYELIEVYNLLNILINKNNFFNSKRDEKMKIELKKYMQNVSIICSLKYELFEIEILKMVTYFIKRFIKLKKR